MEDKLSYIAAGLPLSFIVLYAFWLYARKDTEINAGTWVILAYGDILEFWSYFAMTERWWLNLVPASFAIGSITIFAIAFFQKRFAPLRKIDIFCIIADVLITIVWWRLYESHSTITFSLGTEGHEFTPPTVANLLYQASAVIAFVPMWWSQVEGHELEHPAPWLWWGAAFLGFSILTAYAHESWEELVYPFLNIFTHFMIGATAITVRYRLSRT